MTPTHSRWLFQGFTIFIPVIVAGLLALYTWSSGDAPFEPKLVISAVLSSLITAMAHLQRMAQEAAERAAEVVTKVDQDDDNLVEQPEGGTP